MKIAVKVGVLLLGLSAGAAQSQDWSGFYGGLNLDAAGGKMDYGNSGALDNDFSGSGFGAFAGYNLQRGNVVYGGELAFASTDLTDVDVPAESFKNYIDLKGRVGFAAGKALYYGVLGYSFNTYHRDGSAIDSKGDGFAFGFGMDYMVSEKMFVGGELLRRTMINPSNDDYSELRSQVDTLSLRLGMKF